MTSRRLDVMVVAGRGKFGLFGNLAYVTGFVPFSSRVSYAVIEPAALPAIFASRPEMEFAAAGLQKGEEVVSIGGPISELEARLSGAQRVGVAGGSYVIPWKEYERRFRSQHFSALGIDAEFAGLKAVKTEYDVNAIMHAYRVAEAAVAEGSQYLVEGCPEVEVVSAVEKYLRVGGCVHLNVTVQTGAMFTRPPQNRSLTNGELVFLMVEFAGLDGVWVEKGVLACIGAMTQAQQRIVEAIRTAAWVVAQEARVGLESSVVWDKASAAVERFGFVLGDALGHGIGIDQDLPRLGPDSMDILVPDSVLAVHPHIWDPTTGLAAKVCDIVIVHDGDNQFMADLPFDIMGVPN